VPLEGEPSRRTRILCVDDDPAANRLHAFVLGDQPDMDVVGAVSRPEEVLSAIERLRPDVVLLDYVLGGTRCQDLLRDIAEAHPSVRVVILSGFEQAELTRELSGLGAAGFVTKGSDLAGFLQDIRHAIRGCNPPGSTPSST
jgi:DNA-binding NarL/FixJ family response regulator